MCTPLMGGLDDERRISPSVKVPAVAETTPQPRSVGSGQLRERAHRPATQWPIGPQEMSQDPQWYWSLWRSSQKLPQAVSPGSQAAPQWVPSQVACPPVVG